MATQHQAMFEAPVSHEAHYSNPYSNPEFEDEWESHEAIHEAHYSNPYSNSEFEDEWETAHEAHYSSSYSNLELEADQFFFLAPLAAIAAKKLAAVAAKMGTKMALKAGKKLALKAAKKVISKAPKILNQVQRIQNQVERVQQVKDLLPSRRSGRPQRELEQFVQAGEQAASTLEAEFFGHNEFEAELANHTDARDLALTELLAHEAARSQHEQEAEYLLETALPITLRSWNQSTQLSPQIRQSLAHATTRLVQDLHRQGRDGRQLLLALPTITRRTLASLEAISARGRPITPGLVQSLVATHTTRVLSTPNILGPVVVRNFAIRRATPVPLGQLLPFLQR